MARLNQTLLHKVAKRLSKKPQYIREQVSRRASREAVSSDVALIMWARSRGIGVASALNKVPRASSSRSPCRECSGRPRRLCAKGTGAHGGEPRLAGK